MKQTYLFLLILVCMLAASCGATAETGPDIEETANATAQAGQAAEQIEQKHEVYASVDRIISNDETTQRIIPQELAAVEEKCDVIVRGIVGEEKDQVTEYSSSGMVISGMVTRDLEITQVIEGDFQPGDVILLGEHYYYRTDESGTKTMVRTGNYMPSVPGTEYIFFLKAGSRTYEGIYGPQSVEYGRYPVPTASMQKRSLNALTNDQLGLGAGDTEQYLEFYEEVIAQYLSE